MTDKDHQENKDGDHKGKENRNSFSKIPDNNEKKTDNFSSKLKIPQDLVSEEPEEQGLSPREQEFKNRLDLSPRYQSEESEDTKSEQSAQTSSALTIVTILNNSRMMSSLDTLLKSKGFTVFGTLDGDEGINLITEHKPDIILLDLLIPGKNGLVIVRSIRSQPDFEDIPIIMFLEKSHASQEQKNIIVKMGVNECLTKPFLSDWLFELIKKVIQEELPAFVFEKEDDEPSYQSREAGDEEQETGGTWLKDSVDTVNLNDIKDDLESILRNLSEKKTIPAESVSEELPEPHNSDTLRDEDVLNQIVEDQKIARLDRLFQETQQNLVEKEQESKNKDQEIQFLKTVHNKLKDELQNKDVLIEDLQNRLEELTESEPQAGDEDPEQRHVVTKLNQDIHILLNRIQFQVSDNLKLKNILEEKRSLISQLLNYRDRYIELKDLFEQQKTEQEELHSWRLERQELKNEMDKLQSENETLSNTIDILNVDFQKQQNDLNESQIRISQLENSLTNETVSCSELENQISILTDEKEKLTEILESQKTSSSNLTEKLEQIEKGKQILRDKVANDLVEKEVQIMKLTADIESYQVIFESYYKAREDLKKHSILDGQWPDMISGKKD